MQLAARLPNARAWVGIVYFLPTMLGIALVNLLPWSDKVGLLFGQWITGASCARVLRARAGADAARTAGISITGFVLSLSWLSNVAAGHTKRVTTNAIMLVAYCVENAAGPFMWQAQYLPRCARLSRSLPPPGVVADARRAGTTSRGS